MIVTLNAARNEDGSFSLVWGDSYGNRLLTSELPAAGFSMFHASLHGDYTRATYATIEEVTKVVEAAREELWLASEPDAHGGPCILIEGEP